MKADPKDFQTSGEFTFFNVVIFYMVLFMSKPVLYVFKYQA